MQNKKPLKIIEIDTKIFFLNIYMYMDDLKEKHFSHIMALFKFFALKAPHVHIQ